MRVDSVPDTVEEALDEFGELLVVTDAGERYELHKHNVEFTDNGWMAIEGSDSDVFVDSAAIESFEVHYDI